jgi:hypothetical protein
MSLPNSLLQLIQELQGMDPPRPAARLLTPAPHYIPHRFIDINYRNDYLYGVCYGISYTFLVSAFVGQGRLYNFARVLLLWILHRP